MHGALGTAHQLHRLHDRIGGVAIDLSGHGSRAIPAHGIRFEDFLKDIDEAFVAHDWERADLFGYSMGGYAALLYATQHPQRVRSVVTLGTKYLWTEEGLLKELRMLDPEMMEQKVPAFAQALASAHGATRWKEVVVAIAQSMSDLAHHPLLTPEVCARIPCPTLLCVGEKDGTAIPADTQRFAQGVKGAEVFILPGTPHPFDKVDLDQLEPRLRTFWASLPT
ncbi:MAG: alpha/beta fold hydrolase [Flavobacteriales bacterium]|nr:alpha/beta fold hydrolase [Flavobacteriales bacterium]